MMRGPRAAAGLLLLAALCQLASAQFTVTTTYGPVVGQASPTNSSVRAFIGIPFAAPPVGSLRWAPPQAPANWTSPRVTQYPADMSTGVLGVMCAQAPPQVLGLLFYNLTDPAQSYIPSFFNEDCLYLNVWTPCRSNNCNLPVIVFMHGGAWVEGSAMLASYDGTHFAESGAVFVAPNYRLGALGFLASAQQAAGSLNVGLQDQQQALRWVQANARAFGGDPTRVMLTGESAGSEAVSAHLVSPGSAGLFRRGLMESCSVAFTPGPILDYVKPLPVAQVPHTRLKTPATSQQHSHNDD